MARGGSVFVSTDPNNVVPIGVAGSGVFIGTPGPTIFNSGQGSGNAGTVLTVTATGGASVAASKDYSTIEYFVESTATVTALPWTFANGWLASPQQTIYIKFGVAVAGETFGANVATSPSLPTSNAAGDTIGFQWDNAAGKWTRFL
jgi:hypothetical protein